MSLLSSLRRESRRSVSDRLNAAKDTTRLPADISRLPHEIQIVSAASLIQVPRRTCACTAARLASPRCIWRQIDVSLASLPPGFPVLARLRDSCHTGSGLEHVFGQFRGIRAFY